MEDRGAMRRVQCLRRAWWPHLRGIAPTLPIVVRRNHLERRDGLLIRTNIGLDDEYYRIIVRKHD